ncbi:MAG TPA: radical SAM protein [Beijerinckiaceae bacterium]|nr:radical SAM protein [Beijerinckiaceae bacterium]
MIKPSHYDDDGYVIQWMRSIIPSNSLASVYGLVRDCAERRVLGPDVEIVAHAWDETNRRIRPDRIERLIRSGDGGVVFLIGVQSNQFPRALDLARSLIARGLQVVIGGFHVSGVIAMLDGEDPDLRRAREIGVSLFAGEAEGRLDQVLQDAFAGRLAPLYDHMQDLPGIEGAPLPVLPAPVVGRTIRRMTSFDAGRGCPYQCSFCTIINVQGRKSRRRSPDDVEQIVRANLAQGLQDFFVTDDNFARNKDWEAILDRLIYLRRIERLVFSITIQVDTLCHRLPRFIEKCALAGVKTAFIGLENINPANLIAAKKRQNRITEYRKLLLAFKQAGILTYAGYILGFPQDTKDAILHDIEVIKRELPLELLEVFYLTPLPGSEDHQRLHRAGVPMDPDLNKYDLNHRTTGHARMSPQEWDEAYAQAWRAYYSWEHIETIMRRAAAKPTTGRFKVNLAATITNIAWFKGAIDIEGIHPLEMGVFRLKFRRDRRPERGLEPAWRFYPKLIAETLHKQAQWAALLARLSRIYWKVTRDPKRHEYMDAALTPVTDAELATAEMFRSDAARAYLGQEQRLQDIRAGRGEPAEREPRAMAG